MSHGYEKCLIFQSTGLSLLNMLDIDKMVPVHARLRYLQEWYQEENSPGLQQLVNLECYCPQSEKYLTVSAKEFCFLILHMNSAVPKLCEMETSHTAAPRHF